MIPIYIIQSVLVRNSLLEGEKQDELAYFLQKQLEDPRFNADSLAWALQQHYGIMLSEQDAIVVFHQLRQL